MLYPEPPFNMLISGITGCGKTHFVLDLLQKEYAGKYDHIIIICPTFLYNKTYERTFVLADPDVNPLVINDRLNEWLDRIVEIYKDKIEHTLIIIDDCANLYDAKLKATALTKLAFHGRHINISTWIITQKYNAIVKDFRENIKILVLFYDKDKESREAAFKENDIGISSVEKENIIRRLRNEKTSKLVIQLYSPFDFEVLST
jgi:GTPase SAR1 family protein